MGAPQSEQTIGFDLDVVVDEDQPRAGRPHRRAVARDRKGIVGGIADEDHIREPITKFVRERDDTLTRGVVDDDELERFWWRDGSERREAAASELDPVVDENDEANHTEPATCEESQIIPRGQSDQWTCGLTRI